MSNVGPNAGDNNTGDNTSQTQDGQTDPNSQQQQQNQNNSQNNDDNFDDMWQDPDSNKAQTTTPQDGQQQQQQQTPNVNEVFDTYIQELDLTKGIDLAKVSEELNQGNTESLGKAFSEIAAKTYRQAMLDMSKVIDQKVQAGVTAAVQQSSNAVHGNLAVKQMNTTLEFTKNPAIAPIANAALSQLIKKGKSVDDAVEGVRRFFQNTSKISAKELGLQNPPRGRPGNQPFSGPNEITDDDDDGDWMETLGVV